MAKTALAANEERKEERTASQSQPNALAGAITGRYHNALTFFGDVRNEMRKVVTPSRKEVQATTTVVLVTVFVFAFYFWIVDYIFGYGLGQLLTKLGGPQ